MQTLFSIKGTPKVGKNFQVWVNNAGEVTITNPTDQQIEQHILGSNAAATCGQSFWEISSICFPISDEDLKAIALRVLGGSDVHEEIVCYEYDYTQLEKMEEDADAVYIQDMQYCQ